MLVPISIVAFLGSRDNNHTAKSPRDVIVHLVHLGRGTLQVVEHSCVSCVSSF